MNITQVTCILLLLCHLSVGQPHASYSIAAIVNKPLTLPCSCSGQEVIWTTSYFYSFEALIADCNNGTCQITKDFQERFTFLNDTGTGNLSLRINSIVYNDIGYYTCTCDRELVSALRVNVYDPVVVEVFEGDNATLPCYGKTRRDARDVQWRKDGGNLAVYNYSSAGESPASRITMSKKGFQNGDLSLLIESVQHSDGSLYLCLIHGGSREGDPRAVVLKVKKPPPEPSIAPNVIFFFAIIIIIVLIIGVITLCVYKSKEPNEAAPVQEQSQMIPKPSSTQIIQD